MGLGVMDKRQQDEGFKRTPERAQCTRSTIGCRENTGQIEETSNNQIKQARETL
jgi:hypothetical protein